MGLIVGATSLAAAPAPVAAELIGCDPPEDLTLRDATTTNRLDIDLAERTVRWRRPDGPDLTIEGAHVARLPRRIYVVSRSPTVSMTAHVDLAAGVARANMTVHTRQSAISHGAIRQTYRIRTRDGPRRPSVCAEPTPPRRASPRPTLTVEPHRTTPTPRPSSSPTPTPTPRATGSPHRATATPRATGSPTSTPRATGSPTPTRVERRTPTPTRTPTPIRALSPGAVLPLSADPYQCPAGYPVKGNRTTSSGEWLYHLRGGAFYDRTRPEECFANEADARAAGYRASRL